MPIPGLTVGDRLRFADKPITADVVIYREGDYAVARDGETGRVISIGTDHASVIQAAINSLTTDRTWFECVALKGEFIIRDSIKVPDYTFLDLTGTRLFLAVNTNEHMIVNSDQTNGNSNIIIKGGVIVGNKDNQTEYVNGIYFKKVTYFWIEDVKLYACRNSGISIRESMYGYIKNCIAEYCGTSEQEAGFEIGASKYITLEGCTARYGGRNGFEIEDGSEHIFVVNCIAHENGVGAGGTDFDVHTHPEYDENMHIYFINCKAYKSDYGYRFMGESTTPKYDRFVNVIHCKSINNAVMGLNCDRQILLRIHEMTIDGYGSYGIKIDGASGGVIEVTAHISYATSDSAYAIYIKNVPRLWKYNVKTYAITHGEVEYLENVGLYKNSGTATIPAGSTSVTVEHGLASTPSKVIVTPLGQPAGKLWIENITDTSFDILTDTAPSSDLPVAWFAEV